MRPRKVASQRSWRLRLVRAPGLNPLIILTQVWVKLAFASVHDQSPSMPATHVGANCQLYPMYPPPTNALFLKESH
jgi:hypothetical protein